VFFFVFKNSIILRAAQSPLQIGKSSTFLKIRFSLRFFSICHCIVTHST